MEKLEKLEKPPSTVLVTDIATAESQDVRSPRAWLSKIASWGIEVRGIAPVPVEERTDRRYINVFFVWFTMSTNLLPIVTGMVGTLSFGLSLRDASLVILFFSLLCAIPPAYLGTFGARTGLRQMLHARFTFGYYLISIIVVLNLCTIAGFGIIDCVLGGMTLAAVSDGQINATVGIVIIALCGMVISFGGYRFLHQFERYSWIFTLVAIVIATGVGGRHLATQAVVTETPAPATIVSFGGVIAGFLIPWAAMASDFAVYCHPSVSTFRIFTYIYAGLLAPSIPLMVLGAAIGAVTSSNPSWSAGNDAYSAGGILEAMLHPVNGFGKFVTVLLAFSLLGNLAAAMYSISLNFQIIIPIMSRVPRFLFTIIYTAIAIPVSISAATSFFNSLENFLYIIAYWSAAFVAIVTTEHFIFRKADCTQYNPDNVNDPRKLPSGIAAIAAIGLSFGLVVPCMSQIWYTGPLAETTGDLGFEVALLLAPVLYLGLRSIEVRFWRV
ncbi:permease for cytosine/purines, uracil, thiamine, allantoin-domain-containing protein [Aspergillus cavernicola]|uniref:Permease for cytosine/purines, uracil, thiamine, allantoin-domain-containing protein n=1 Tax=Aspergillus cavernicola TaxID=176166 RepID=A0ABR4ILN3_9EURO